MSWQGFLTLFSTCVCRVPLTSCQKKDPLVLSCAAMGAGNDFILAYLSLTGILISIQELITLRYEAALMSLFQKELTSQLMNEKGKSSHGTFLSQILWRIRGNSNSKGVARQLSYMQSTHTQFIKFPSVLYLY